MIYYTLTLVIIILTSAAHLLLKKGSVVAAESNRKMYLHPLSLTSYLIFAIAALLSIYAMKGLDLKVFFRPHITNLYLHPGFVLYISQRIW